MKTLTSCSLILLLNICLHTGGSAQWIRTDSLVTGNVNVVEWANGSVYAGTRTGLFRSADHGMHWSRSDSGIADQEITAFGTFWSLLLAGTATGGIFISTDNGYHWTAVGTGMSISNVTAFAHSPDTATGTPALYACFHDTLSAGPVYRTVDIGAHWVSVSSGITNGDARSLLVRGNDLYVGTFGGVFLSTNGGTDWSPMNSGLTVPYVMTMASLDSTLFAGTMTGGAFRCTDKGAPWEQINNGLTNTYVNDLATTPSGALFAGTGWSGVYVSVNKGTQWKQVNTGLMTDQINALAVAGDQQYLFAATDDGVWFRPLPELLTPVPERSGRFPASMVLQQNFPNPFNPSTTIRYALPSLAHVTLTIHDILGREVAVLVDGERPAGWNEVEWNADRFANGIYLCRMTAGNDGATRRMLLLK